MFELTILQTRTEDFSGTLLDSQGEGVAIGETDALRFKLGRAGATPVLDLNGTATAAGSVVTVTQRSAPASYSLRFAQGDTAGIDPGAYDAELLLVVDTETAPDNAAKLVECGIVHVLPSLGGSVGL
jgi:hypothetical protein